MTKQEIINSLIELRAELSTLCLELDKSNKEESDQMDDAWEAISDALEALHAWD